MKIEIYEIRMFGLPFFAAVRLYHNRQGEYPLIAFWSFTPKKLLAHLYAAGYQVRV